MMPSEIFSQSQEAFEDGTFRGELRIPTEQVISLASRMLIDKKGYQYPEQLDKYLSFIDTDSISEWARPDISLAVSSGLINGGGLLTPQLEMTRGQAASLLYKLFMLQYETPPAAFVTTDTGEDLQELDAHSGGKSLFLPVTLGLLCILGIAGAGIWWRHRKRQSGGKDLSGS